MQARYAARISLCKLQIRSQIMFEMSSTILQCALSTSMYNYFISTYKSINIKISNIFQCSDDISIVKDSTPCKYTSVGCTYLLSTDKRDHELECKYRQYICLGKFMGTFKYTILDICINSLIHIIFVLSDVSGWENKKIFASISNKITNHTQEL